MSSRKAKADASLCGCCGISKSEKKLFHCGGCKSAQYCSPECQKQAWKDHKVWCKHNRETNSTLASVIPSSGTSFVYSVGKLNAADSVNALRKWCHNYRNMITWASHNALELNEHPEHSNSHVFVVLLDSTPAANAGETNKPLKMFSVKNVSAIEKTVLAENRPDIGKMIAKADAENDKVPKKDRMKEELSIILVMCDLLVNLMPCYWNWNELGDLQVESRRRDIFLYHTAIKN
ncbi:hypothetical protein BDZ94DRAFT_1265768 [Collybia nuda]|uniref:MYND-type domain-containing protein n=1 Tax=Collybia nuda TaxID=64659 RepID=A0A9P5Y1B8_9AGAR|nr:hypothetical protein BDZ94DRAFT_1265768 [Collybia nuda]